MYITFLDIGSGFLGILIPDIIVQREQEFLINN